MSDYVLQMLLVVQNYTILQFLIQKSNVILSKSQQTEKFLCSNITDFFLKIYFLK